MTLTRHPSSDHQIAVISLDAGMARDIMLMLAGAHAVTGGLAGGEAPAAARQGTACLREASSPHTLHQLADAPGKVASWLHRARRGALAGIAPLS